MNELTALRMARQRESRQRTRRTICLCEIENDATICVRVGDCDCGHGAICHARLERRRERKAASRP